MLPILAFAWTLLAITSSSAFPDGNPHAHSVDIRSQNATPVRYPSDDDDSDYDYFKHNHITVCTELPAGSDPPIDGEGRRIIVLNITDETVRPRIAIEFSQWERRAIPPNDRVAAISNALRVAEAAPQPLAYMTETEYEWQANKFAQSKVAVFPLEVTPYRGTGALIGLTWQTWANALRHGLRAFNQAYPGYWVEFDIHLLDFGHLKDWRVGVGRLQEEDEADTDDGNDTQAIA